MLFSSGWTLDEVLDLSWEQLATVTGCMLAYKSEQVNLIMEVISSSLGGKVSKKTSKKRKKVSKSTKEASLLRQFQESGLSIENVGQ